MQEKLIKFFKDKNIAILGFGMEGQSTYHFIRKYLKEQPITILDQHDIEIQDKMVTLITGSDYLNHLDSYDVIMKTPGISFKDLDIRSYQDKIYSQLELLLQFHKEHVIGITGTKGKSTTTSLIYQALKDQLHDVLLVGNIGKPIFDEVDHIYDNTIVVAEMSSHQLEFVNVSPHIGIILNLYEDHLDHAGSVDHYHSCKLNMFQYQNEDDISIYASDNETLKNKVLKGNFKGKFYSFQLDYLESAISRKNNQILFHNEVLYVDDGNRKLLGDHNLENIMVVVFLAKLFGLDLSKVKKIIDSFTGLPHRLEFVGKYDDIIYYNDTIATIPMATIHGIKALGKVNTLIFGGMDRGIDYQSFVDFLSESDIENLICMPSTGNKIGGILENRKVNKNIYYALTLEEAVRVAKEVTKKNMICLLSPAASSYEYFKNFEEKGNKYKELVRKDS